MNLTSRLKSRINAFLSNPQLSQGMSKWSSKVLIVSVGLTITISGVRQIGLLQSWELHAFDWLVSLRLPEKQDHRLLVVGFTDDDINNKIPYPLSDEKLAEVITILQDNNARVICLDIFRDIKIGKGRPELNKAFENGNVIVACGMSDAKKDQGIAPPSSIDPAQVGFLNVRPDHDDIIRRALLISSPPISYPQKHLCNDPQQKLQSVPFLVAQYYLPENINITVPTNNTPLKIGKAEFKRLKSNAGGYRNLDTNDYQILINYRSNPEPIEIVSFSQLLNHQVDAKIKDRAVFIGYTGTSFKDTFPTPYTKNAITPGVLIHAQVASQIISAVENGRSSQILYWDEWQDCLWILGWALVGGLLTWRRSPTWLVITSVVITMGGLFAVCWVGLNSFAYWLPMLPSFFVLVGTSVIVLWSERIRIAPEIDWDSVREEESKKKEQSERIARSEFFQQLQEKANQLQQQLIYEKHDLTQDSYYHKNYELSNELSTFDNWLEELAPKAKQMRQDWENMLTKSLAQKKESIRALAKRSQYLLNRYEDPNK